MDKYKSPLLEMIGNDAEEYGNYLTIRYWISQEQIPRDKLDESVMDTLYGVEPNIEAMYFEIAQYTWANEEETCRHDIIRELQPHINKYCRMEIIYSKHPEECW